MKIYKFNVDSTWCVGDIHGAFSLIAGNILRRELHDCALIFCGDCGFGFEKPGYYEQVYKQLHPRLRKNNIYCIFIRGNHDDPAYFDGERINHKRFMAVPDYSIIQTFAITDPLQQNPMHNILCIGGAISVDRLPRIDEMNKEARKYMRFHLGVDYATAIKRVRQLWWPDEAPIYDAAALDEIKQSDIVIDTVCTHTAPDFCQPVTKERIQLFIENDPGLEKELKEERELMTKIYRHLQQDGHPLSAWFYGHYHWRHREYIEGTCFTLLDCEVNDNFDMMPVCNKEILYNK